MEVARSIEQERHGEVRVVFAVKFFDQTRRRGEAQLRSPFAGIDDRQIQWFALPGVIEIKMESAQFQRRLRN